MESFLAEWKRLATAATTVEDKNLITHIENLAVRCQKEPHFILNSMVIRSEGKKANDRRDKSASRSGVTFFSWPLFLGPAVKQMRLEKIASIEEANRFLERYLPIYNKRFKVSPAKEFSVW